MKFFDSQKRYWDYRMSHKVSMSAPTSDKLRYYVNWYYYTHDVVMPEDVQLKLDLVCYLIALGQDVVEPCIDDENELIDEISLRYFNIPKNWNDMF